MKAGITVETVGIWQRHFEAWQASGISQHSYCKQEGLSYRHFVYQRNRLKSSSRKAPIKFVEAKREPVFINHSSAGIQLMLPNGIRIGISAEINPVLLQAVLQVAGSIQC